jgi:hypothetical protein
MKKRIVLALEDICERTGHHWCHRLAMWSYKLDVHWGLGIWSTVEAEDSETSSHTDER